MGHDQCDLDPPLPDREVHVWQIDLDSHCHIAALQDVLSPDERRRCERYQFLADRASFLARHAALRSILSRYVGIPPACLVFAQNAWGKPRLRECEPSIAFNMSSSRGLALIAVTGLPHVGIDIECDDLSCDCLGVARQFFSSREVDILERLGGDLQRSTFFRLWTCKEALVKAIGQGLSLPLDRPELEISLARRDMVVGCSICEESSARNWRLRQLEVDLPGYYATLCTPSDDCCIRLFSWNLGGGKKTGGDPQRTDKLTRPASTIR